MTETVIAALLSLVGTVFGSIMATAAAGKLTAYRLERLERKVDLHNNAVERLAIVEVRLQQLAQERSTPILYHETAGFGK